MSEGMRRASLTPAAEGLELERERGERDRLRSRLRDATLVWLLLGVLLLVVVPLLLRPLFGLDAPGVRAALASWLPAVVPAWLVIVAALVTVRRPGVALALESLLVGWGLGFGLVASAFVLLLAVPCVTSIPAGVVTALMVALFLLAGGVLLVGGAFGVVWCIFVVELASLPRGEQRQELVRVAHVAAPGLVVVAVGTTASADSVRAAELVLVPAPLAVALTLSAVVVGASLWLRLRRRAPDRTE